MVVFFFFFSIKEIRSYIFNIYINIDFIIFKKKHILFKLGLMLKYRDITYAVSMLFRLLSQG